MHISGVHTSESKRCYNVIPSVHYFYVKKKMVTDFEICISVPSTVSKCMGKCYQMSSRIFDLPEWGNLLECRILKFVIWSSSLFCYCFWTHSSIYPTFTSKYYFGIHYSYGAPPGIYAAFTCSTPSILGCLLFFRNCQFMKSFTFTFAFESRFCNLRL